MPETTTQKTQRAVDLFNQAAGTFSSFSAIKGKAFFVTFVTLLACFGIGFLVQETNIAASVPFFALGAFVAGTFVIGEAIRAVGRYIALGRLVGTTVADIDKPEA